MQETQVLMALMRRLLIDAQVNLFVYTRVINIFGKLADRGIFLKNTNNFAWILPAHDSTSSTVI